MTAIIVRVQDGERGEDQEITTKIEDGYSLKDTISSQEIRCIKISFNLHFTSGVFILKVI